MAIEPFFDAGRSHASVREAQEERTQAELAYRLAVLGALRDVEDALARYRAEETRRESLLISVNAAEETLAIAKDQHRTGFVTFVNVLQAQYALLNAEDQLTQSDALVVADLVAIYKALGGVLKVGALCSIDRLRRVSTKITLLSEMQCCAHAGRSSPSLPAYALSRRRRDTPCPDGDNGHQASTWAVASRY